MGLVFINDELSKIITESEKYKKTGYLPAYGKYERGCLIHPRLSKKDGISLIQILCQDLDSKERASINDIISRYSFDSLSVLEIFNDIGRVEECLKELFKIK